MEHYTPDYSKYFICRCFVGPPNNLVRHWTSWVLSEIDNNLWTPKVRIYCKKLVI